MKTPIPRQAAKYMRLGLSVAPSDGGWLASYKNSVNVTQEIGIWPDEITATRAGVLWCQGYRFDVMRAEYELPQSRADLVAKWGCGVEIVTECIILAGGSMRQKHKKITGKTSPMSKKGSAKVCANLEKARAIYHARREIAFLEETD